MVRDIFKDSETVHKFKNDELFSIELDPNYGTYQQFVTGGSGQELLLRSIGFFRNRFYNKVLHGNEGSITNIIWQNESNVIAWSNNKGVKIYDMTYYKPIAHINGSSSSPDNKYECCLCWENAETLLIGWYDSVKIIRIRTIQTQQGHTIKEAYAANVFVVDFKICGIVPFKQNLILLAFIENNNMDNKDNTYNKKKMESNAPELHIVSRRGEWIASDSLPINGYKQNDANHYKLIWNHEDLTHDDDGNDNNDKDEYELSDFKNGKSQKSNVDETFYILSPSDIVVVLPRTVEEHIRWLLDQKEYENAFRESVKYRDELIRSKLNPIILGEKLLFYILNDEKEAIKKFGEICSEVCLKNKILWEKWIHLLFEKGKLRLIIDVIPIKDTILNKKSYELILEELIKNDESKFLQCIKTWDASLYTVDIILSLTTNRMNEVKQSEYLMRALTELKVKKDEIELNSTLHSQINRLQVRFL